MSSQDLKQCNSPDAVIVTLLKAAVDFAYDAQNLDGAGQNGRPWTIIAEELDKAAARSVRRIIASGYPVSEVLKEYGR